jgi:tRNA-dihydrouridine synthase A
MTPQPAGPAARPADHRLSVAPMMDCTDRHFRRLLREVTKRTRLYTEMVTAAAVRHGDRERLLRFSAEEHPIALQLGGAEPDEMALAAECGARAGYDEVNMNVGCPSDRVQAGRFGACLMAEPETVAACVAAMRRASGLPVTVKTRIGIDDGDEYSDLRRLVDRVADAGCEVFVVHARKAWLKGLSPKQNREIPPLRYESVRRLKDELPGLTVVINGGLTDLDMAIGQLERVDGAMIGRAAYSDPFLLADADRRVFGADRAPPTRRAVVAAMLPYIAAERERGTPLSAMTRHLLGLFQGVPGARAWRRRLTEGAAQPGAGPEVVAEALELVAGSHRQAAA